MLKYIKNISLFIAFFFFAYSCNSYQYYTIDGTLPKSQFSDFFFENDTLQIIYTFNGMNGPVTTKIYNKLESPLYIDWDQSYSLINAEEIHYTQQKGSITNNDIIDRLYTPAFPKAERIDPKSQLITVHTCLNNQFIKINNKQSHNNIYRYNPHSDYPFKIKEYYFTEDESPIIYKNHISYTTSSEEKDPSFVECDFWVSKVFKTTNTDIPDSPDRFVVTKINNTGIALGVAAITCISFLSILATPGPQNAK